MSDNSSPSVIWSSFKCAEHQIRKCFVLGSNYIWEWIGVGASPTPVNILFSMSSIQAVLAPDYLSQGILYKKSAKMFVLFSQLWKIYWNYLRNFSKLRNWGIPCPNACLLCNCVDESPSHLFYNCSFPHHLWLKFAAWANQSVLKALNIPNPVTYWQEILLEGLREWQNVVNVGGYVGSV